MPLRCGIVGLPNVGKSTLFNGLTGAGAVADNYPFATIDANVGVATVPDSRLDEIAAIARPREIVRATVEFVDIAGLVEGASRGEGLGNQFLAHIREVDAIAHVVRCFEDPDVSHVAGDIDPASDIAVVELELALADLGTVERAVAKAEHRIKTGDKEAARRLETLEVLSAALAEGQPARDVSVGDDRRHVVRDLFLLTAKPVMYIANTAETVDGDDKHVSAVRDRGAATGAPVVEVAAQLEAELAELPDDERAEFLTDAGQTEPALERIVRAAYDLLGLSTFFTQDEKEAHAWPFRAGTTAVECAGLIHTDFQRGFVGADVVSYSDFVSLGGEAGAREAGKYRLEGRDHEVRDGDVIRFRFNL